MLQPEARLKIISRVKTIVVRQHFNIGNIDYVDWSRTVEEQIPTLLTADDNTFENGIRDILGRLGSSHTNFYRSDTNPTLPQHLIGATFRSRTIVGAPKWMFLDVFEDSPAASVGISPGQILLSVDGVPAAPPDFPVFRFGQTHELAIQVPNQREIKHLSLTVPMTRGKRSQLPLVEPKSVSFRMLQPRLGIVKIAYFSGAFGFGFSTLLDDAIESLKERGCDRLIIDLRGCLGGSLGFARLASYLSPDRIPIGYDVTRKRLLRGYNVDQLPHLSMPCTKLGLMFCLLRFAVQDKSLVLLTQGLGKQPFHGHVAVLINEWTNSAAEIVAQFAKETRLATVIGTQTRGNVLGAKIFDVGFAYKLYLPIFGWYGPSGIYTEGSGIYPDVHVDIDPDELALGNDRQLNRALETLQ